jgi:putative two-component system response regulator
MEDLDLFQASTILVVDDDMDGLVLLERLLRKNGCTRILTSPDPAKAISLYMDSTPDLVLLDFHMPGMNGVQFMRSCRKLDPDGDFVPFIVMTGDMSLQSKGEALEAGANDFLDKYAQDLEITLRIKNFLRTRHLHLSVQRHNLTLEQEVKARTKSLEESQDEIVQRLALAAEHRDDATSKHVDRVGNYAAELTLALGIEGEAVDLVRRSAKLHDVGKLGIPDSILHKPGALTPEERATMQTHTVIGDRILANGTSPIVRAAQVIARSHHEKWDGSGYPDRLAGEAIPRLGRIVAVADVFDALVTERPYKEAFHPSVALEIIKEESGKHFEPQLVEAFLSISFATLVAISKEMNPMGPKRRRIF